MQSDLKEFIAGLPKAELHVHVGGTLSPQTEYRIAQRNHINLGVKSAADIDRNYAPTLSNFLHACHRGMQAIQTGQDLYEIVWDFLNHLAQQNVRHVEMSMNPQDYANLGIPYQAVITNVHQAIVDAQSELGIDATLILSFVRNEPEANAFQTLAAARPYHMKGWFSGVGLDAEEYHNPPLKFAKVFQQARREGYHLTIHADVNQEHSVQHINQAVNDIQVDRLDQGVNIVEDPQLMKQAIQKQIGFAVCPISNQYCANDMKVSAILDLLQHGVLVSINSDDPGFMGGNYINDNYLKFAQIADLSKAQLVQIAKNSFLTSWISPEEKQIYLQQIDNYVRAYEKQDALAINKY